MTPFPEGFQPMKGEAGEIEDIRFPCFASPKLDGYRCIVMGGVAYTANLTPFVNLQVQKWASENAEALEGLDGELCVGPPNDPEVFKRTGKFLKVKEAEYDFTFWVFDRVTAFYRTFCTAYEWRYADLEGSLIPEPPRVRLVDVEHFTTSGHLEAFVNAVTSRGYEGVMVRSLEGPYKFGRSTIREGYLVKLKKFIDHEAEIISVEEEMRNLNKAEKDARGRTKRSSHKANKVGKGTLGKFIVRGLNGPFKGVEFSVSTGTLTKVEKAKLWEANRIAADISHPEDGKALIGQCITYKHMAHSAGYEKPRHAGFLRFRPRWDIDCS